MILRLALFELRYQLRQPLAWIMAAVFFAMTFFSASTDAASMGGAIGNIHRNAPLVILRTLGVMSVMGMLITTVFVAGAILRDFERKTHELIFSRPVATRDYLLGRFLGACLVSFAVFLGAVAGMALGCLMWWIDPETVGPFLISPYLYGSLVLALPNLFLMACVFFSLASWSRSMMATYLGVVGFFATYAIGRVMLGDLDSRYLAAMLDPFGLTAVRYETRYWTVVEQNAALPELGGVLLYNRLVWLAVGLMVLGAVLSRFRTSVERSSGRRWWRRRASRVSEPAGSVSPAPLAAREATQSADLDHGFAANLQRFLRQTRLETVGVFKSPVFVIMLAFGLVNLLNLVVFSGRMFSTPVQPVTHLMVQYLQIGFAFLLVIIIAFYSGELIWKERSTKLDEVFHSLPVPDWVYLGSKLVAQMLVVLAFLAAGVLTTIGYQLAQGYTRLELGLYAQGFVLLALPFLLICVLSSFLQVAAGGKFLGYLLMILYLISADVMTGLDFGHYLYRYPFTPDAPYSDMNGYGHFAGPLFWFNLYWILCASILTLLTVLFWTRGKESSWRSRLAEARQRFRGPIRPASALAVVAFLATGIWIFYNTNILNEYVPEDLTVARQADYEKKFRQYRDVPLPRISDVQVEVDIFPYARRVEARGRYLLVNRTSQPLETFHMTIPARVTVHRLDFAEHTEELHDEVSGYRIYRLDRALAPGEETALEFDLTIDNPGFVNNASDTSIVYNGTFFNNRQYFPSFGYNAGLELRDRNDRRKHGLPPPHRMAPVGDLQARRNQYISFDADWIHFEATVSTVADQIAIAPGYLQREWQEGGRRFFHYEMDAPILHFYSFLSAEFTVARDAWRHPEGGEVAIEIYHHAPHTYNVDRMIESVKKSLDYFTESFGPYQHRQMRIIEFPRYQSFAQAFPNTVPFSEAIGFIARFDPEDEGDIDYPFYVTAHEVAHQWWAHQVISGNVQGARMLTETMAQYSALMVMEKEYGPEKMRRFLKFELDNYLRNRSRELVEEMPLMLVEDQGYIHYRKGSVVMYALKDALGEDVLNDAIARYAERVRYQQPPYTNTLEFLDVLRESLPEGQEPLIADLFENITLFENRVEEARFSERADGKFQVTIEARARKLRADGQGNETEVPLDDWIDVGVFGERRDGDRREDVVLFLEKRRVTEPELTFEVVVDARPARAGIDPYNKLVDRDSNDNVRRVKETQVAETGNRGAGGAGF